MVFEKLTLFEVKLEGAPFGTRQMNDDDAMVDDVESGSSRGRRGMSIVLGMLLIVGAVMYVRRSSRREIELEDDREDAQTELTSST